MYSRAAKGNVYAARRCVRRQGEVTAVAATIGIEVVDTENVVRRVIRADALRKLLNTSVHSLHEQLLNVLSFANHRTLNGVRILNFHICCICRSQSSSKLPCKPADATTTGLLKSWNRGSQLVTLDIC